MTQRTILVVDDDPRTIEIIRLRLERDGFRVLAASDGEQALTLTRAERPDLIVLDLMLPKIDGMDVTHILREEHASSVPIIMVTARAGEEDKLLGLDVGADDYLTKPFSPRELTARINAVLRRSPPEHSAARIVLRHGDLAVDLGRHTACLGQTELRLTPTEFTLLATLMAEPHRAFSRSQLIDRVFGYSYQGVERGIDVHVTNLRKKVEPDPATPVYIVTVYGVGYRFDGLESPNDAHP